ncbi:MAG: EamA family transporter [Firmicutes bacterium]|nr:EamA family transporter [Bacillota bacterium]
MNQKVKGFAAVMISAVFFGLVPLFVQSAAAGGSNTYTTAFYRFFLPLLPMYIYLRLKNIPITLTKKQVRDIVLITICGYGGTSILLFSSYRFIPSGMATTIHFLYPVFVILGSILFLREKVRPIKLVCVALCFGGTLLFYGGGEENVGPVGILLAFASAVTYAFYIIYLERSSLTGMETLKLIFYMNTVASALILVFALAQEQFVYSLTPVAWLTVFLLGLGGSFIGVFLFQRGVLAVGGQTAAILSTLEPITSLAVGALVYHESFGLSGIAGCVLILTSVAIVAKMEE